MTEPWYKRQKTKRRASILTIALLILGLLFTFGPTYVARYFITDILDDFNIEHEGVKTLRINPWKREIWLGPVRFRTGEANQGQLDEVGVKFRVFPAFQKHAMVEKILIRGVDIFVSRDDNKNLLLNGIPLDQLGATDDDTELKQSSEKTKAWGIGLIDLDMQDSRVIFQKKAESVLKLEVDSLQLNDFSSWQPDETGSIKFKGRINDIEIDLSGQARPFAKHVTVKLDASTKEMDLSKIVEFTGPLGLERQEGVYNSDLSHEIKITDTGHIEGHSSGTLTISELDYKKGDVFDFKLEQAAIDLDTHYSFSEEKKLQVNGDFAVELNNAGGSLPGENTFSFDAAEVQLSELRASSNANNALHIVAKPQIDIQQGTFSGQVELSMDMLLDILRYLQSISSVQQVADEETGLETWADEEVTLPKSDISWSNFNGVFPVFELNTTAGNVLLNISTDSKASDIKITATERSSSIDSASIILDALTLRSGEGKIGLNVVGHNTASGFGMSGPIGKAAINTMDFNQKIDLNINRGDIMFEGSSEALIKGSQFKTHKTENLPSASLNVDALTTAIKKISFSQIDKKVKWKVESNSKIDGLTVDSKKGKMVKATMTRLELSDAQIDHQLNIGAKALIVNGLDVDLTRQFIDGLISDKPIANKIKSEVQAEKLSPEQSDLEKSGPEKPVSIELKIDRAALKDGAQFRFRDDKVDPRVDVLLDVQTAELLDVDTRNPKKQAQAKMLAKINEFTHFELDSNAKNLGEKLDLTLKGKLENLELHPYSSYTAEFGGVYFEQGQLSSEVGLTAVQGVLDGAINLHVKKLEFTSLSEEDEKRLSDKVGMPVETAASLLKDSRGNIDLSFPVTGTVNKPDVDVSSAISKAVGNTLKSVFPPTLILSILTSGTHGEALTFEPIKFAPGSSELDATARKYMDELVILLNERPSLSLKICGRATPADFKELTLVSIVLKPNAKPAAVEQRLRLIRQYRPEMLDLAIKRTRSARRYLIKEKGLAANQVGECRSQFDPNDTGPPRVTVTL